VSMTKSVGEVGPSHWSYMAGTLARRLGKIVRKKRIEEKDIPQGVYVDAKEFFELIVQALGARLPENPPASMNAYHIASEILRTSVSPAPNNLEDLEGHLERYSTFIHDRMARPTILKRPDLKTARELRKFFLELEREGEAEAYERRVAFDESSSESRFGIA
jgi:hypothetical protein